MRKHLTFTLQERDRKRKLLSWASGKKTFCLLDSNRADQLFTDPYSFYDFVLASDPVSELKVEYDKGESSFSKLSNYYQQKKDWLFGYFSYDLKNEIENLTSSNADQQHFPALHFFQPR